MVDGTKPREVAEKIKEVYSNFEKYQGRVEEGYKLSKKYTWEEVGRRTYDILKNINLS